MGTVTYLNIDSEIVSETRSGTTSDYLPDSLGSTIGLLNSSQTLTDTWTYWPYGETASRTGTNVTPMQFVGTLGYHQDTMLRTYVRARVFRIFLARWQTVDSIWPAQSAYLYALDSPIGVFDADGRGPGAVPADSKSAKCRRLAQRIRDFCLVVEDPCDAAEEICQKAIYDYVQIYDCPGSPFSPPGPHRHHVHGYRPPCSDEAREFCNNFCGNYEASCFTGPGGRTQCRCEDNKGKVRKTHGVNG